MRHPCPLACFWPGCILMLYVCLCCNNSEGKNMTSHLIRIMLGVLCFLPFLSSANAAPACITQVGMKLTCWVDKNGKSWCRTPSCEIKAGDLPSDWHDTFYAPAGWTVNEHTYAAGVILWVQNTGDIKVDGTGGNGIRCWWRAQGHNHQAGGVAGYCFAAASATK